MKAWLGHSEHSAEFQAMLFYHISLYFANLSNKHLLPTLLNNTVAFSFSPTPSTLITLPMPKRWCSMVDPTARLCFSVAAED